MRGIGACRGPYIASFDVAYHREAHLLGQRAATDIRPYAFLSEGLIHRYLRFHGGDDSLHAFHHGTIEAQICIRERSCTIRVIAVIEVSGLGASGVLVLPGRWHQL